MMVGGLRLVGNSLALDELLRFLWLDAWRCAMPHSGAWRLAESCSKHFWRE